MGGRQAGREGRRREGMVERKGRREQDTDEEKKEGPIQQLDKRQWLSILLCISYAMGINCKFRS